MEIKLKPTEEYGNLIMRLEGLDVFRVSLDRQNISVKWFTEIEEAREEALKFARIRFNGFKNYGKGKQQAAVDIVKLGGNS